VAKLIKLTSNVCPTSFTKLEALTSYNITPFIRTSWSTLSSFAHSVTRILYQYHSRILHHRVYKSYNAKLFLFIWPSGEILAIPSLDESLLLHHHQYNWLKFYPFVYEKRNEAFLETSFFPELSSYNNICYLLVGRDHWGHFVLDFLSRYLMSIHALQSSPFSTSIVQPIAKNQSIFSCYESASSVPLHILPSISSSSVVKFSHVYLSDYTPPLPFLGGLVSHPLNSWDISQRHKKACFLFTSSSSYRIANHSSLLAYFERVGIDIIDPLKVYSSQSAQALYSDYSIIISPHGSAMLNPLIFTRSLIIGLFPKLLFTVFAHPNDIAQYSDIALMFGTRIFPVFGLPVHSYPVSMLPVNQSIDEPHTYDLHDVHDILSYCFNIDL